MSVCISRTAASCSGKALDQTAFLALYHEAKAQLKAGSSDSLLDLLVLIVGVQPPKTVTRFFINASFVQGGKIE